MKDRLVHAFAQAALSPDPDLAVAALMIARIEYPSLDAGPTFDQLDAIGRRPPPPGGGRSARCRRCGPDRALVMALNDYLFGEMRFVKRAADEDPRNSRLNEGWTAALASDHARAAMEAARRGVSRRRQLPGHFLVRCPAGRGCGIPGNCIIDAFHSGAPLSRDLFRRRAAGAMRT
jgi:hypothetical protein